MSKFSNPLSLNGGMAENTPAKPPMVKDPETPLSPRRKMRFVHEHDVPEVCCVGRCIMNDNLEGWDVHTPCEAAATDDVLLTGFQGVPEGYTLYFCKPHSVQFRSGYKLGESLN